MKNDSLHNRIDAARPSSHRVSVVGTKEDGEMSGLFRHRKSERGMALVIVLIVSAVALVLMTTLIYMTTESTESSGMMKRFKTSIEVAYSSAQVVIRVIKLQETSKDNSTFHTQLAALTSYLNAAGMAPYIPSVISGCTSTTPVYSGIATKVMTDTVGGWGTGCNSSLVIKSSDENLYDLKFYMGTSPKYTVYAKIVNTRKGNTSGTGETGRGLGGDAVVGSPNEIKTMTISSLYTVEIQAESATKGQSEIQMMYEY